MAMNYMKYKYNFEPFYMAFFIQGRLDSWPRGSFGSPRAYLVYIRL
jgi:hypothetical protein